LIDLQLSDRNESLTELIAKAIVNVTATGERDPENIKERALCFGCAQDSWLALLDPIVAAELTH
jgi:hypothetical protein